MYIMFIYQIDYMIIMMFFNTFSEKMGQVKKIK